MSELNRAPVDLFIKMHRALVAKNYSTALNYCNTILNHEQTNTMKEFHKLLTKKLDMIKIKHVESRSHLDLMKNSIGSYCFTRSTGIFVNCMYTFLYAACIKQRQHYHVSYPLNMDEESDSTGTSCSVSSMSESDNDLM